MPLPDCFSAPYGRPPFVNDFSLQEFIHFPGETSNWKWRSPPRWNSCDLHPASHNLIYPSIAMATTHYHYHIRPHRRTSLGAAFNFTDTRLQESKSWATSCLTMKVTGVCVFVFSCRPSNLSSDIPVTFLSGWMMHWYCLLLPRQPVMPWKPLRVCGWCHGTAWRLLPIVWHKNDHVSVCVCVRVFSCASRRTCPAVTSAASTRRSEPPWARSSEIWHYSCDTDRRWHIHTNYTQHINVCSCTHTCNFRRWSRRGTPLWWVQEDWEIWMSSIKTALKSLKKQLVDWSNSFYSS